MILLINSGVANIGSWLRIIKSNKLNYIVSDDIKKNKIEKIKKIIFPGVGNFGKVMHNIKLKSIDKLITNLLKNEDIKYLGICVGMQILFAKSEEDKTSGLNLIEGEVKEIKFKNLPRTHNGWNNIKLNFHENEITKKFNEKNDLYFNHSYYCRVENNENQIASLEGFPKIATIVNKKNIYGLQFHPEKSHDAGKKIIENFLSL
jgi:glutamine amidotransferase